MAIVDSELREKLAQYAHEAWSGWMDYLFTKGTFNDDGTFTINDISVSRWRRQAATLYSNLPENEKESDRDEADKIMWLLGEAVAAKDAEIKRLNRLLELERSDE